MDGQSFLKGAFTLLSAGIVVKIMGFAYQMAIVRLAGTEAIGIFNMVSPFYSMAMILTCTGIPAAIVRFIPEHRDLDPAGDSRSLLRMAAAALVVSSSLVTVVMLLFSPGLLRRFGLDSRAVAPFLILLPTLLMIAVSSSIRSFFQGNKDMKPTAGAQLIEQSTRLVTGIGFTWLMAPYGIQWAIIAMALGVFCSELSGFLFLWRRFSLHTGEKSLLSRPSRTVARELYGYGLPLTATRLLLSFSGAAEALLLPHQLKALGMTVSQAASFYGQLTGIVFPLLNIPTIITLSLSTALIPTIAQAQKNREYGFMTRRIIQALALTLVIGIPTSLGLYFFAGDVVRLLFKVEDAILLLKYLAPAGVFLWLSQLSNGILQGMGLVVPASLTTLFTCLVRLGGIWLLTQNPATYPQGICFSFALSFTLNTCINLILIRKNCRYGWCKAASDSIRGVSG
ncbi:MAG: polysaccharide biosynthesis protein [Peptococcaceae bacterium]|nr:polysaccharide biosynthesis protein [Peptococcaceae bacterium]